MEPEMEPEATPCLHSSGALVTAVGDGDDQFLQASAHASVAATADRHMLQVRVLETSSPGEASPRQVLRVGFSTLGPNLVLKEGCAAAFFDWEGYFVGPTSSKRLRRGRIGFGQEQVFAVMVNVGNGPDRNSMSLFVDGLKVGIAQPLPEELLEKPLYPIITYKNVTLQVSVGPTCQRAMPFKCRILQHSAGDEIESEPKPKLASAITTDLLVEDARKEKLDEAACVLKETTMPLDLVGVEVGVEVEVDGPDKMLCVPCVVCGGVPDGTVIEVGNEHF